MSEAPIRILIADDHSIVRKGIHALLATEPDFQVVGEVGDGISAVQQSIELHPDVVLMDLMMPKMNGIEATARITADNPAARVLVLTSFAANDQVFPAIKAGAAGYLLKDSSPEDLIRAIRQVHRGESWLHPAIARKVLQELTHTSDAGQTPTPAEQLTERELDVLRLLAQGFSNKEIAERLVLSDTTVRTHVSNILGKLHLASRTQAALYALRKGLTSLDEPPD